MNGTWTHQAYITLGSTALNAVYETFNLGFPVFFHLPMLTAKITLETPPILHVILKDRHCMPTSDCYFTSIQPEPIVIPTYQENNSKPKPQQAAARDPTQKLADTLQPGKTCMYPSMLTAKQNLLIHTVKLFQV